MGLKTASVTFPTCAEYYDSNRADQLLLERRRNKPQTSRRCRLLADTAGSVRSILDDLWCGGCREPCAQDSRACANAAPGDSSLFAASHRTRVDMDRALLLFVFFICFFPLYHPPPNFLLLLHGFFSNFLMPEERDQK